jgi:DNA-binding NarL/FixJ family response regulator
MSKYQQLTPTQQQIYNLIVLNGTKTKDIALKLNKSLRTVERNIETILEKYAVETQKELIIKHYTEIIKEFELCPSITKI